MNKNSGFGNNYCIIKSVHFPKDKISILFTDGRILILPIGKFPEIARLKPSQKRKHKILAGMGLMFDDLDTVFHISDFLGKIQINYPVSEYSKHSGLSKVAEPKTKYHTRQKSSN